MFCPNCGTQLSDNANACVKCGEPLNGRKNSSNDDKAGCGLTALSFLIPLTGWILYFVFRDDKPNTASSCATTAWIGFFVNFILYILIIAANS